MITSPGPVATNSFLYKDMPFDPARWTSIALLATGPYVLVMRKSFEGATVKDLIARAKANPGKITAAHAGRRLGRASRDRAARDARPASRPRRCPIAGLSPAVNDLIAGHVDLMFDTPTTSLPLHRERQGQDHRAPAPPSACANSPKFRPSRRRCPAIAR